MQGEVGAASFRRKHPAPPSDLIYLDIDIACNIICQSKSIFICCFPKTMLTAGTVRSVFWVIPFKNNTGRWLNKRELRQLLSVSIFHFGGVAHKKGHWSGLLQLELRLRSTRSFLNTYCLPAVHNTELHYPYSIYIYIPYIAS